jgi:hypothetical protein
MVYASEDSETDEICLLIADVFVKKIKWQNNHLFSFNEHLIEIVFNIHLIRKLSYRMKT